MASNIGPEMLEILDEALAKGEITQARYDAKRAEVMVLIQKGRAIELEPIDRTAAWVIRGVGALPFALLALSSADEAAIPLGLPIFLLGLLLGAWVMRRGWVRH